MKHGLIVPSEGKSGGLALLWKEGINEDVQMYSQSHIDAFALVIHQLLSMNYLELLHVTGEHRGHFRKALSLINHQLWHWMASVTINQLTLFSTAMVVASVLV